MGRVLGAMAGVLVVIAVGLLLYAGSADDGQRVGEYRSALQQDAGLGESDPGSGGGPWRLAAAITGGLALVLGVGALAAPRRDGVS